MTSLITVKLLGELPDDRTALCFENEVQARINPFGGVRQSGTRRYWKIPEWFEFFFTLQPGTDPELAFGGILSSLGAGWERHDLSAEEQWAVWNPSQSSTFFSPHVRWANVERFPESSVVSH
jgi:hypothetical protein